MAVVDTIQGVKLFSYPPDHLVVHQLHLNNVATGIPYTCNLWNEHQIMQVNFKNLTTECTKILPFKWFVINYMQFLLVGCCHLTNRWFAGIIILTCSVNSTQSWQNLATYKVSQQTKSNKPHVVVLQCIKPYPNISSARVMVNFIVFFIVAIWIANWLLTFEICSFQYSMAYSTVLSIQLGSGLKA